MTHNYTYLYNEAKCVELTYSLSTLSNIDKS